MPSIGMRHDRAALVSRIAGGGRRWTRGCMAHLSAPSCPDFGRVNPEAATQAELGRAFIMVSVLSSRI